MTERTFEGFTFVTEDVFEFGDQIELLPIYRFDRFAEVTEHLEVRDPTIEFVVLPGGTFTSGFSDQEVEAWEPWFDNSARLEASKNDVTVGPFLIARTLLTQRLFDALFEDLEYSDQRHVEGANVPVHGISFDTSQEVAKRLGLEVPTGEQWEFACRGGSKDVFPFGPAELLAREYAWFDTVSPMGVAQKRPNGFGLFDMTGNVWEWCSTPFSDFPARDIGEEDVPNPFNVPLQQLRGGAWNCPNVLTLMSSFLNGAGHQYTGPDVGLRLVLTEKPATAPLRR